MHDIRTLMKHIYAETCMLKLNLSPTLILQHIYIHTNIYQSLYANKSSWQDSNSSASQDIRPISQNPNIYYRVQKSLIRFHIPSQINKVHRVISLFLRSILILSRYLCAVLRYCLSASGFPTTSVPFRHMPPPSNLLRSDTPLVIMKNSFHTPRETDYIIVTKIVWPALFREITRLHT